MENSEPCSEKYSLNTNRMIYSKQVSWCKIIHSRQSIGNHDVSFDVCVRILPRHIFTSRTCVFTCVCVSISCRYNPVYVHARSPVIHNSVYHVRVCECMCCSKYSCTMVWQYGSVFR